MNKLFLWPLLILLISCQQTGNNEAGYEMYDLEQSTVSGSIAYNEKMEAADEDLSDGFETEESDGNYQTFSTSTENGEDRQANNQKEVKNNQKIIRTARMTMETEKYDTARVLLEKVLIQFEARVEKEEESRSSYRVENQLNIRVAPEKLDALIEAVITIGIDVDSKSVDSRNVTRQYVDLETRLASKRAVIDRYRDILKSARTIKDILDVEEHLRVVVEEVESMEGQLRVLKDQVGESTLHLTIYESFERPNVKKKTFWSRMGKAIGNGWRGGQEFLIGVVSLWPFWIIGGGLFWFIRRIWKRRKQ